jgi:V/A-type H+-transporting ATPase subunit I
MIPVVGIVITVILLLLLHLVNLGLSALGAGVHSLRLQYVEFFNRFYEGGGHSYTPFKIKRKYTKLEKENIGD